MRDTWGGIEGILRGHKGHCGDIKGLGGSYLISFTSGYLSYYVA